MDQLEVKYYGFAPLEIAAGTVVGIEKISQIVDEMRELHALHYAETETLYLESPFDPDYAQWAQLEREAKFVLFTTRVDGKLVGYLQYYVYRDAHSRGSLIGREDAFFLRPEVRGQGLAPKLLKYAEDILAKLGCKYIGMSSKGPVGGPDIGPFLESRGYRPVAVFYSKKVEGSNDVLQ
jgi:GNAT superfamily N-acetyltransferase